LGSVSSIGLAAAITRSGVDLNASTPSVVAPSAVVRAPEDVKLKHGLPDWSDASSSSSSPGGEAVFNGQPAGGGDGVGGHVFSGAMRDSSGGGEFLDGGGISSRVDGACRGGVGEGLGHEGVVGSDSLGDWGALTTSLLAQRTAFPAPTATTSTTTATSAAAALSGSQGRPEESGVRSLPPRPMDLSPPRRSKRTATNSAALEDYLRGHS